MFVLIVYVGNANVKFLNLIMIILSIYYQITKGNTCGSFNRHHNLYKNQYTHPLWIRYLDHQLTKEIFLIIRVKKQKPVNQHHKIGEVHHHLLSKLLIGKTLK